MKHTPKPWEATPSGIVIGKRVANGSMDLICNLKESPYVDDIPYNSLIIAAAPELLEACKNLMVAGQEKDAEQWFDALVFAKQVIAKAEGRE